MVCIIPGPLDTCILQVASYVIYGVILFITGLLMASFIPTNRGKQLGLALVVVGLVMSIGFSLISEWWNNSVVFRLSVLTGGLIIVLLVILFPKSEMVKK